MPITNAFPYIPYSCGKAAAILAAADTDARACQGIPIPGHARAAGILLEACAHIKSLRPCRRLYRILRNIIIN